MLLHRLIMMPCYYLHFFHKKVTTLFQKVTIFYLMIFLKIQKLLFFPKSRAHVEKTARPPFWVRPPVKEPLKFSLHDKRENLWSLAELFP